MLLTLPKNTLAVPDVYSLSPFPHLLLQGKKNINAQTSLASRLILVAANALDTGQPTLASFACF